MQMQGHNSAPNRRAGVRNRDQVGGAEKARPGKLPVLGSPQTQAVRHHQGRGPKTRI